MNWSPHAQGNPSTASEEGSRPNPRLRWRHHCWEICKGCQWQTKGDLTDKLNHILCSTPNESLRNTMECKYAWNLVMERLPNKK